MRNLLILSIFNFILLSAFGQENRLHFEIQQAKNMNINFEDAILHVATSDAAVLGRFVNTDEVFFFENTPLNLKNNDVEAINLSMPMNNKNMVLELIKVPDAFYNYKVITSDGDTLFANRDIKHYRGIVKDEANSFVAITFYEDEIIGLVCTDEGNFNLARDKQLGKHIFYNDRNLKDNTEPICTTPDDISLSYDTAVLLKERNHLEEQQGAAKSFSTDKMVRFYVETEYDIYISRGSSISSVEAFVSGLFNQVAALYQNEDIFTRISSLYIWTSAEPYTQTNGPDLLSQFQLIRTTIDGDLGMLLTFRGESQGAAARINGLCSSITNQKLAVSMIDHGYNAVPAYSRSVKVVTHEFGHLLGSHHTHACVWNNNNTAIDGCAGYTQNENGEFNTCAVPGSPSGGGTVMSYCDQYGQPGVNFNLGFGTQPGNVIRNIVANASCLQRCDIYQYFTNQSVTTNKTVKSCNINAQNVTVSNNAKLIFEALDEVTINGNFEIGVGSELEIK